ncbi:NifB/NifX family molybdenum-iron cluster-binding protein [Maribacter polysaccharolyticus]|uniref:NifB/NifX family molybdenum-iron cluster-binding protein n=1 Tax=Maribacter polysaccharolyticus TaxID=3020831 RepID=UPI00237F8A75|nr:NifB/NifX family molybdenum-iron cluster-binding protein [Maribacter polysaccharolyticus]MDE3741259.1 NifB/NifX family molybdenum-iron cluster-binding protein [Maribacter polysaccharolyticus]
MKTLITSSGENNSAQFDKRFGRAAWFCVFDEETKGSVFIKNTNAGASNGAGTMVAEQIVSMKVQKVISGDFGPKAKDLLDKFNVQMVIVQDNDVTVQEIIEKLKA